MEAWRPTSQKGPQSGPKWKILIRPKMKKRKDPSIHPSPSNCAVLLDYFFVSSPNFGEFFPIFNQSPFPCSCRRRNCSLWLITVQTDWRERASILLLLVLLLFISLLPGSATIAGTITPSPLATVRSSETPLWCLSCHLVTLMLALILIQTWTLNQMLILELTLVSAPRIDWIGWKGLDWRSGSSLCLGRTEITVMVS